MQLLSPMGRRAESGEHANLRLQPCGGLDKQSVHFSTTPGSRNFIAWKVSHPAPAGNCTLRLGLGPNENEFKVLHPLDKSANKNGSFPCGREETTLEGKEVRFPKNFTCDMCTLQLEWVVAEKGNVQQHYCADVTVIDRELEECAGKCLGGGICMNGECRCRKGTYGAYCQYKESEGGSYFFTVIAYLALFAVVIVLILGLFYGAYIYMKKLEAEKARLLEAERGQSLSNQDGRKEIDNITDINSGIPESQS